MTPVVDGLQADYGDWVAFTRLDAANEGRAAFAAYNLRGHPSYVIIDTAGKVLWKGVGKLPGDRLEEALRQALGDARYRSEAKR
jgi:hypothetical protein